MEYQGLTSIEIREAPHLGGNIDHGDPYTFAPSVTKYLIERFALRSMLDLGSGQGHAAALFHRNGVVALACDGLMKNVENNVHPTVLHDVTISPFFCNVDLVWCQEVAEHIEEKHIDNFVQSLSCGKVILMTHAVPGQNGYHHVNCQTAEYWLDVISRAGYKCAVADTNRVRALAQQDGATYLARTGLLFIRH